MTNSDFNQRALEEYLLQKGAVTWLAMRLARNICKYFSENIFDVVNTFLDNGWTMNELHDWLVKCAPTVNERDSDWAADFERLFSTENMLIGCGMSRPAAHKIVTAQAWTFTIDPRKFELTVRTLLGFGYEDAVLCEIATRMHHVFFMSAKDLLDNCRSSTRTKNGLLCNIALSEPAANVGNLQASGQVQTVNRARTKVSVGRALTHQGLTKTSLGVSRQIAVGQDTVSLDAASVRSAPELRVSPEVTKLSNRRPVRKAVAKKPAPLTTFTPLHGVVEVTRPKPPPLPAIQTSVGRADDKRPREGLYIPVWSEQWNLAEQDDPNELTTSVEKPQIVFDTVRRYGKDRWAAFVEKHPWVKQSYSDEFLSFAVLLRWAPLHTTQKSIDDSTSSKEVSEAVLSQLFWRTVLIEDAEHEILSVGSEKLEVRMWVLRFIGKNFAEEPALLLSPWEEIGEAELRFRKNEIEARGKNPHLKPYIGMLLAPTRENFLERLETYLKKKAKPTPKWVQRCSRRITETAPRPVLLHIEPEDPNPALPGRVMTHEEVVARLVLDRSGDTT